MNFPSISAEYLIPPSPIIRIISSFFASFTAKFKLSSTCALLAPKVPILEPFLLDSVNITWLLTLISDEAFLLAFDATIITSASFNIFAISISPLIPLSEDTVFTTINLEVFGFSPINV